MDIRLFVFSAASTGDQHEQLYSPEELISTTGQTAGQLLIVAPVCVARIKAGIGREILLLNMLRCQSHPLCTAP